MREVDRGHLKQKDIAYVKNVILAMVDTKSKRVVNGRNETGWSCSSQMLLWKGCRLAKQLSGKTVNSSKKNEWQQDTLSKYWTKRIAKVDFLRLK